MLVVELQTELEESGAIVIGPFATLPEATKSFRVDPDIDGAVLDLNLSGKTVFPLADLLLQRTSPFISTIGYDAAVIPSRYSRTVRCEKPVDMRMVIQAIGRLIHSQRPDS